MFLCLLPGNTRILSLKEIIFPTDHTQYWHLCMIFPRATVIVQKERFSFLFLPYLWQKRILMASNMLTYSTSFGRCFYLFCSRLWYFSFTFSDYFSDKVIVREKKHKKGIVRANVTKVSGGDFISSIDPIFKVL